MSNPAPTTPNLGIVITSPTVRKGIYGSYIVALVIAGAAQVAYSALQLGQPGWLVAALAVLAYLGIPVGGLALVNSPSSTPAGLTASELEADYQARHAADTAAGL